ncbi:MAG: molybdenum cofactor guanylyltransferase [Bacteroidota bacterium]
MMNEFAPNGFSAIILAGGAGSRMGREKCSILLDKKSLLDRTIDLLIPFSDEILISSNTLSNPYRGYRVIQDMVKGQGPLAGLSATLGKISAPAAVVLPCDTPLVPEQVLRRLCSEYRGLITVLSIGEKIQPLCGIYPASFQPVFQQALENGELKLQWLLRQLDATILDLKSISPDTDPACFLNINTPDSLEMARQLLDKT